MAPALIWQERALHAASMRVDHRLHFEGILADLREQVTAEGSACRHVYRYNFRYSGYSGAGAVLPLLLGSVAPLGSWHHPASHGTPRTLIWP